MNTQVSHHQKDSRVFVECYVSRLRRCEFYPGTVKGVRSALDRDYRVHVVLDNGWEFEEAAPECVIPNN